MAYSMALIEDFYGIISEKYCVLHHSYTSMYSTALLEGLTVFNDITSIGILCSMVFTQFEYCVLWCSMDYYTLLYPVIWRFMVNSSCSIVF